MGTEESTAGGGCRRRRSLLTAQGSSSPQAEASTQRGPFLWTGATLTGGILGSVTRLRHRSAWTGRRNAQEPRPRPLASPTLSGEARPPLLNRLPS